jgi:hypothetical protein
MTKMRMLHLLPMMLLSSISISIYGGLFVPMITRTMHTSGITSQSKQNEEALVALIFLGLGEILGSIVMGMVRDRINNHFALSV